MTESTVAGARQMILRMGALAEAILEKANRSVRERDETPARQVKADDLEIDRLDVQIDDEILRTLALHPPVAEELRLVFAIKSMANDLERVGDLARNMADSALRLAERPETRLPERLEPLQIEAARLLRMALDAFQRLDAKTAREVLRDDDRVDELQDEIVQETIAFIGSNIESAPQAVDVILIAENLERVGDHATNIAEDVILIAEAKNVKHAGKL